MKETCNFRAIKPQAIIIIIYHFKATPLQLAGTCELDAPAKIVHRAVSNLCLYSCVCQYTCIWLSALVKIINGHMQQYRICDVSCHHDQ